MSMLEPLKDVDPEIHALITSEAERQEHGFEPVSYTHLTLPTIYSV